MCSWSYPVCSRQQVINAPLGSALNIFGTTNGLFHWYTPHSVSVVVWKVSYWYIVISDWISVLQDVIWGNDNITDLLSRTHWIRSWTHPDAILCEKSLSVTCDSSVIFTAYSSIIHRWNWPPWYCGNIVESGVDHDASKP
jgi:hypothetical protein